MPSPPTVQTVAAVAAKAIGQPPIAVRRFAGGAQHFVFEAIFAHAAPVVVRFAASNDRAAVNGAGALLRRLRSVGVPVPRVIADGLEDQHPYLVLERLPGTDLGNVVYALSP